jgi:tetratricopeptide (TPR) repeat protein
MKKNILLPVFLLFLLTYVQILAQEIPVIDVKKETPVSLSELSIRVEVFGNIASTTYDMKFYNPNDRVLEGELSFPLGQGQNVSRFALDLNGKLREAVVVEKEKGRVAFEKSIKQRIDPALLEKTKGNNYKARVYPIPAKGTKRVVVSFDQELLLKNNAHFIYIPLKFKKALKKFKIEVIVHKQTVKPIIEKGHVADFIFDSWEENFVAKAEKNNYVANSPLKIKIPIEANIGKVMTYGDYFYFYKVLQPKTKIKSKPKTITLLWDTSLSLKDRKLEKELKVIDNYLTYLKDVNIKLIIFSNEILLEKVYKIRDGNWESLKKKLTATIYDGGTSFKKLNFIKKTDEYLLFTDGIENLGGFNKLGNIPVYVINSEVKANHNRIEQLCNSSGGNYINLMNVNLELANKLLKNKTYRFLGYERENNKKFEIYPNNITNITSAFSIAGKGFKNGDTITLLFGYGTTVTKKIKIKIDTKGQSSDKIKFIWAQKKINSLVTEKEKNKDEIIKTSKKYQIISPFTSLIVLDRIEDYVRYKIEPPLEFIQEYKKRLAIAKENELGKKTILKDLKDQIYEGYSKLDNWWNTEFKYSKEPVKKKKQTISNSTSQRTDSIRTVDSNLDPNARIISGVVSDASGFLPGANITVKNSLVGTQSDFDGKYQINAQEGDVLVYTFIGMNSVEVTVGESNVIDVKMEENGNSLDEVVVTGYSTVQDDREDAVNILSGKVSGITGNSSAVAIRGSYSINNSNKPLYIIDGIPIDKEVDLHSLDVQEMYFLKPEQSISVFGARAASGVIVVKTKQGMEINSDKILEMDEIIEDNIELKPWQPDAEYLKELNKEINTEEAYLKYIELRKENFNLPAFYMDVSDFFEKRGARGKAIRILTNLAEIDLDNYELLKVLAYKLEEYKRFDLAINIYQEILKLRTEDIQSYRDLALCYKEEGNYQEAIDMLYRIVNGELLDKDEERNYEGIESIAFIEMNNLISRFGSHLNLNAIDKKFIKNIPIDIRVVIDWNHNDTDIDLWVTDPNQEKCYYKHTRTKIGGKISNDMTEGFGPENFILKKVVKGEYKITINYYSDSKQKISGPTFLKVPIFKNYGRKTETENTVIYRLDKEEAELEVGKIKI